VRSSSYSSWITGITVAAIQSVHGGSATGFPTTPLAFRLFRPPQSRVGRSVVVDGGHGATWRQLPMRAHYFSWSGPLCSAHLVKGVWRDEGEDHEYWWSVEEGEPGFYSSREGASQDQAVGGAFGFLVAQGVYDDSDPPVLLTRELS
jgi:hypothetical protein